MVVIAVVVAVIVIAVLFLTRESMTAGEIQNSIKDMVDNNLNLVQYRAKYGSSITSLRLNYLINAYKARQLTAERVHEIMSL